MPNEVKKLEIIEKILHISDDELLRVVEKIIGEGVNGKSQKKSFKQFAGLMSNEEADAIDNIIAEGCEKINPNDWD